VISNLKYRNLLISSLLIISWTGLIMLFSAHSNNELGNSFNLFIWVLMTRYFALFIGMILLLLRIVGLLKEKDNLFYILIGILNCVLGLLPLLLYTFGKLEKLILSDFQFHLLLSSLIVIDIFFLNNEK
jgi:cell division protein FtsW (lipid II flippase)